MSAAGPISPADVSRHDDAWLVVIDPQTIFASPDSPWGSPMFPGIVEPIRALAADFTDRVVVTRFVPPTHPRGSWNDYYRQWPFAAVPGADPKYAVVDDLQDIAAPAHIVDESTFGKWGESLRAVTGEYPTLVLAGVSTDCCVLNTALAAADAGARVRVEASACAGSTWENHERALATMELFAPQIRVERRP